jgi:hypothetical protein
VRPTTLYRFYDRAGALLYIGITLLGPLRFRQHSYEQPWWLDVATCDFEHYVTRQAAIADERRAIQTEHPQYNDLENGGRHVDMPWPAGTRRLGFEVSDDGCWTWVGGLNPDGYATFGGRRGSWPIKVHRFMYALRHGDPGQPLDHICRNRACGNPDHMEPVTIAENVRRGASRSGVLYVPVAACVNGHRYDEGNTLIDSAGARRCRTCTRTHARLNQRAYRLRRKDAAATGGTNA